MKHVIYYLVVITISFILASCGDNNDEPKNLESQLIGEWVETLYSPLETIHINFKSNHSGSDWWTYYDDPDRRDERKFDWEIDGYYLLLEGKGFHVKTRFTITNGILHFDDYFEDLEFKRVK